MLKRIRFARRLRRTREVFGQGPAAILSDLVNWASRPYVRFHENNDGTYSTAVGWGWNLVELSSDDSGRPRLKLLVDHGRPTDEPLSLATLPTLIRSERFSPAA